MKIRDIIVEGVVKEVRLGGYILQIVDHVIDRVRQRQINPRSIDRVLKQIPGIENQIKDLGIREGFFVVSPSNNISIAFAKSSENKLRMITVIKTQTPYARGVDKIITVE